MENKIRELIRKKRLRNTMISESLSDGIWGSVMVNIFQLEYNQNLEFIKELEALLK